MRSPPHYSQTLDSVPLYPAAGRMIDASTYIRQVQHKRQGARPRTGWYAAVGAIIGLGASLAADAGFITTDFSSLPPATAIYWNAMIDGGVLKLTNAANSQAGSFYVNSLDPGQPVHSFTARFKALVGGGTPTPADGFSFNFANDLPGGPTSYNMEEGAGTGLTVSFDTYNNGPPQDPVTPPVIDIKIGGTTIASFQTPISLNQFVDVLIDLHTDGTLDVSYGGVAAFSGLATGYTPITDGQFALAARTGGFNDNHWIDDLSIVTSTRVPEPATLALLGLGMAGVIFRRRNRLAAQS